MGEFVRVLNFALFMALRLATDVFFHLFGGDLRYFLFVAGDLCFRFLLEVQAECFHFTLDKSTLLT